MIFNKPIIRPPLKWVGGKTQLLDALSDRIPERFDTYIEPFFGGGALFFALQPQHAVIADSNPELINFYRQLAADVDAVIEGLSLFANTEESFYALRAQDRIKLTPSEAAARTLFLNRTCFNGLYRVNRKGHFNVPYGKYKNPKLFDRDNLMRASELLASATIIHGDYKNGFTEICTSQRFCFFRPALFAHLGECGFQTLHEGTVLRKRSLGVGRRGQAS